MQTEVWAIWLTGKTGERLFRDRKLCTMCVFLFSLRLLMIGSVVISQYEIVPSGLLCSFVFEESSASNRRITCRSSILLDPFSF